MTIAAARALPDGATCLVGIGLPEHGGEPAPAASMRPGSCSSTSRARSARSPAYLPLSIGDGILAETADTVVSVPEIFNYWLQPGRIDVGFLGAAQLDRFANINTTVIGDYDHADRPAARRGRRARDRLVLPRGDHRGSPVPTSVRRDRSTSSPRSATGAAGGDRERLGLRGGGPTSVITDLGVLDPDPRRRASSCSHTSIRA